MTQIHQNRWSVSSVAVRIQSNSQHAGTNHRAMPLTPATSPRPRALSFARARGGKRLTALDAIAGLGGRRGKESPMPLPVSRTALYAMRCTGMPARAAACCGELSIG